MRMCELCGNEIPSIRLKAMPTTKVCRKCLEQSGDVPLIKDEPLPLWTTQFFSAYYAKNAVDNRNEDELNTHGAEKLKGLLS